MKNILEKCIRLVVSGIDNLNLAMKWPSIFCLSAIALIMSYEVFVRYVLNNPTRWGLESAMLAQVCLAFIAMGWVLHEERHISVVVIINRFSGKMQNWLLMVSSALSAIACGFFTYLMVPTIKWSLITGELAENVMVVTYPFKLVMGVGLAFFSLQFIARTYKYYRLLQLMKEPSP